MDGAGMRWLIHLFRLILILLVFIVILDCASSHRTQRSWFAAKLKILEKSQQVLNKFERNNTDVKVRRLIYQIRVYLGTPYRFGGASRRGMDCSGFVMTVYRNLYHRKLPHNASQIYRLSQKKSLREIDSGDLVFFGDFSHQQVNHVGIYLYNSFFVHASISYGVIVSDLNDQYYRSRFLGAGRVNQLYPDDFNENQ